ncbi:hypothetical protein JGH11_05275 [Dysgonomonas sp. Marseille-P4677]|uniref:hypothetical protein n=1 Tax=Dysgonomonas sp. Marseille-P4677 TaxID=2364790 RepID=UPI001914B24B|nr:hypothetical protein [Dysgonomonas sp. Marseille-P4677]MBK5720277.1 hypothetical protein [Dysgonomonas sp. Marseille-P4677]
MKSLKYIFIVGILVFGTLSCSKDEERNIIPGYPNFKIDLNNLDADLRGAGSIKVFTKPRLVNESVGYSGLLVVSNIIQENGVVSLSAFDLCCPNEKMRDIVVVPSSSDGTATCTKCKSIFDLYSGLGNVKSGPSKTGLQRYTVQSEGNGTVFYIIR